MRLNVSEKIVYSEAVIAVLILLTLVPYVLASMDFTPLQLFHYINITVFILVPMGFGFLMYSAGRWMCRPIEMLSFYRERGLAPPEDIKAAAKLRALNLPFLHSLSILVRYEVIGLVTCLYMDIVGGLQHRETIRLGIYMGVGIAVFPIFSFFLAERFLYPVRELLAETTQAVPFDESKVIRVSTRARLVSIFLATVLAPLIALGALIYRKIGTQLGALLGDSALARPVMWQLSDLIFIVTIAALVLSAYIGILLATSISKPLSRMVSVIRQLEQGNLHARMNIISNDEIGVVSHSFDTMANQLQKNRSELEDLNRNLELRVTEKTENLTKAYERLQMSNQRLAVANRELEEANQKLKEIDQVKSDFISTVSHELRTPLTSIKAFTELIIMKPKMPRDKRDRLLTIVNSETDRLTRLINDILDLTRIESGKLVWHMEQVSIVSIVETAVAGIQSLADKKGLTITTRTQQSLPLAFGDQDRLIQVLTNMLSNSIKFTPKGGNVRIDAFHEEMPSPRIVVAVSDTGVGIPACDQDIIFEKFHRSGDILTNPAEGTGLGLAITRQIVEHHGGKIWVKSKPSKGSTFTFTLPLPR
jgi:signal transduction histidine kinase